MSKLTHLEDSLQHDPQGILRDTLLTQLQAGEQLLWRQLSHSRGEERQQVTLLLNACTQSAQVISVLWQRYHPE
jgi:type III secretion system YseE family protein